MIPTQNTTDFDEEQPESEEETGTAHDHGTGREHQQGLSVQFVRDLLTSCIQAAVALVDRRDGVYDARATRRITIMLKLMTGVILRQTE